MGLWNYCPYCGKRLEPNESHCSGCGAETILTDSDDVFIYHPPVHNIGFFNFKVDFSPYIIRNTDYEYDICSCGYVNKINNEFCYHCGVKRIEKGLSRIIKKVEKPKFVIDEFVQETTITCECGTINPGDSIFCEMCGRKLNDEVNVDDNYRNFIVESENSIFCFCGHENNEHNLFCDNCGIPFDSYGRLDDLKKLCVCSVLNDATSDFCVECGNSLNEEITEIICFCGTRNHITSRKCSNCERPLNPNRILKTKLVCSCGKIMSFDSEYCPNCGKNIRKSIHRRKTLNSTVNSVRNILDGI